MADIELQAEEIQRFVARQTLRAIARTGGVQALPQPRAHTSEGMSYGIMQPSSFLQVLWVDNLHSRSSAVDCHGS